MDKIKLILVEDHQLVREAWRSSLTNENKYVIVAEAETVAEAIQVIKTVKHDVIILDINLKNESGVDIITEVNKFLNKPKIIVVSMMSEYSFIKNMLNIGVKGYVTKNSSIDELFKAIERVYAGKQYLSNEINEIIMNKSLKTDDGFELLTSKEIIVLKEICTGISTKDMSHKLNVSIKTIEGHKTKIYKKLGTSNLVNLLTICKQRGIIN